MRPDNLPLQWGKILWALIIIAFAIYVLTVMVSGQGPSTPPVQGG